MRFCTFQTLSHTFYIMSSRNIIRPRILSFNNFVNQQVLIDKLYDANISLYLVKMIHSLLDRSFVVSVGNAESQSKKIYIISSKKSAKAPPSLPFPVPFTFMAYLLYFNLIRLYTQLILPAMSPRLTATYALSEVQHHLQYWIEILFIMRQESILANPFGLHFTIKMTNLTTTGHVDTQSDVIKGKPKIL